ncbi:MAG TPA: hypothetical protein V6C91_03150, partial [Coleofasciculaceae cyanobacterium]
RSLHYYPIQVLLGLGGMKDESEIYYLCTLNSNCGISEILLSHPNITVRRVGEQGSREEEISSVILHREGNSAKNPW